MTITLPIILMADAIDVRMNFRPSGDYFDADYFDADYFEAGESEIDITLAADTITVEIEG